MEIRHISSCYSDIEYKVNEFILDKEIIDIHFTQAGDIVNAFILVNTKSLQKLTDEEIKVLNALVLGGLTRREILHKFSPRVLYSIEKLNECKIVKFDDHDNVDIYEWAKPKFIFEYLLTKEQQDIVMILKKENELTQIEICNKTRIPRTTVSRKLEELEGMNVVERYLDGTSKKVKLTKWVYDNL